MRRRESLGCWLRLSQGELAADHLLASFTLLCRVDAHACLSSGLFSLGRPVTWFEEVPKNVVGCIIRLYRGILRPCLICSPHPNHRYDGILASSLSAPKLVAEQVQQGRVMSNFPSQR